MKKLTYDISKVVLKNEKSFIGLLIRSKLLKSVHKNIKMLSKRVQLLY